MREKKQRGVWGKVEKGEVAELGCEAVFLYKSGFVYSFKIFVFYFGISVILINLNNIDFF